MSTTDADKNRPATPADAAEPGSSDPAAGGATRTAVAVAESNSDTPAEGDNPAPADQLCPREAESVSAAARWLAGVPLRVQLISVLLGLAALALALFSTAAVSMLRAQMLGQVDVKLRQATSAEIDTGTHEWGQWDGGNGRGRFGPEPETLLITTDTGQTPESYNPQLASLLLQALPDQSRAATQARQGESFTVKANNGTRWRVLMTSVPLTDGNHRTITAARNLQDVQDTVARLVVVCIGSGIALLLLLAGLGYALIRASLRPLRQVEHTAAAIASGQLSSRVPQRDPRTEVGRLGAALNGMLARIESAFAAQTASEAAARASEERMRRFIADASHELRTPLTSISGFTELHAKGGVPDDQLPTVMQRLHSEAKRMGLLVEDLLLLARLDQQRPLQQHQVNLTALVQDVVEASTSLSPNHQLLASDTDDPPVIVTGDEHRLRQVVLNLVNNALLHTPAGTRVQIGVTSAKTEPHVAVLRVADNGPGLTPAQASQVFERFYRADPSRTRTAGGSGLGLSIVAAIVAAHGGSVEVDSQPERGATFTVKLPQEGQKHS